MARWAYDTDCTAATVGATLGLLLGAEAIPTHWIGPIGEGVFVGPGIVGINAPTTLGELTERTIRLVGKLSPKSWDGSVWTQGSPAVDLSRLPGTIDLLPLTGKKPTPWANGELPAVVKQAAGATWTWEVRENEPREILCLARTGARLFLDEKLILDCPPGFPYVPAPHRCPEGSRVRVTPTAGTHQIRVELVSCDPAQDASVILTYPNFHLCPWTGPELPHKAILPAL